MRRKSFLRQFRLYINGVRAQSEDFTLPLNPYNGKVIGHVFLTPFDSLLFEEVTPTLDTTPEELARKEFDGGREIY